MSVASIKVKPRPRPSEALKLLSSELLQTYFYCHSQIPNCESHIKSEVQLRYEVICVSGGQRSAIPVADEPIREQGSCHLEPVFDRVHLAPTYNCIVLDSIRFPTDRFSVFRDHVGGYSHSMITIS